MKAISIVVICVVLIASLLVMGSTSNLQKSRTVWEYKVLDKWDSWHEKEMNAAGAEGWELVGIEYSDRQWAFFKRPKQ